MAYMKFPWNSCINISGDAVNNAKHHISMHWGVEFMHLSTWPFKKRKNLKMCKNTFLHSFSYFAHTDTSSNFYQELPNLFFFFFFCPKGHKEKSKPKAVCYHISGLDRGNHCQKWWGRSQGNQLLPADLWGPQMKKSGESEKKRERQSGCVR